MKSPPTTNRNVLVLSHFTSLTSNSLVSSLSLIVLLSPPHSVIRLLLFEPFDLSSIPSSSSLLSNPFIHPGSLSLLLSTSSPSHPLPSLVILASSITGWNLSWSLFLFNFYYDLSWWRSFLIFSFSFCRGVWAKVEGGGNLSLRSTVHVWQPRSGDHQLELERWTGQIRRTIKTSGLPNPHSLAHHVFSSDLDSFARSMNRKMRCLDCQGGGA